jgi:hypothetical protein
MPPLPVIANTWRCAVKWSEAGGQTAVNVIHVKGAGLNWGIIAAAFSAEAEAGMFDPVSSSASATTMDITPLDGTGATITEALTGWVGNGDPDWIPAVSGLVKLSTAKRGRSYRGRIFLPFYSETAQENGSVLGDWIGADSGKWSEFNNDLFAGGTPLQLCVASYKHATSEVVTAITQEPVLATQRRRQGRLR